MTITTKLIEKMNPCQGRWDNFTSNYANYSGTLQDFLCLEKITYSDKVWVGVRLMFKTERVQFSIVCAENVLHIFESKYPNDKRPRELLEYLKTIENFETLTEMQREEILRLRLDAVDAAVAAYAAVAAADAAVAANAAVDAAAAAAYAAVAAADAYAANTADAAAARTNQEDLNLLFMYEILNVVRKP